MISSSSNNKVLGNLIGTEEDGNTAQGNPGLGVFLASGSNNTIGDGTSGGANTIAFNGGEGVSINESGSGGNGNRVLSNSIFSNEGLGIALGGPGSVPRPNDPGDADSGPNNGQNFPS